LGAERVVLAATQACRIASDGAEFAAELGREFDLDRARVLTGEEEARLSRLGVLSRLEGPTQGAWLADIGGGSTELAALGREGGALSLPLGAVGLTRGHLAHDPPRPEELAALDRAVARGLAGLGARPARLTATAGTAASLAALLLGHAEYRPDELNNLAVTRGQLERETARLAAMDLRARRSALALEPRRAEIILGGLAILRGLVDIFGLTRFTVMDAGLLEGILLGDGFAPTAGE
jgi:exopolyphosphatase/guanosine-5'-triphosphate,3'-diphosphate pyrophosphatase